MPYAVEIDHARSRLTVIGSDPVSLPDVLALLDRQIAAGAWSYSSLHDARNVTWMPTPEDIRTIVAHVDNNSKTLGPRGSVAFVAAGQTVLGIARMYSQIGARSAHHAEIFQDIDAAKRWLDREAATRR
jgi:hypothetical protein